jgi:hypothetical protein
MDKAINDLNKHVSTVLNYKQAKFYLFTVIFSMGNIMLPLLCHSIPNGGKIFLPIYFFTLVGATLYGWQLGVATALFSIITSYIFRGMPAYSVIYIVLIKSVLISVIAHHFAKIWNKITIFTLVLVVISYQLIGLIIELFYFDNAASIIYNYKLSLPGMLIQVIFGYFAVKVAKKYEF